VFRAASSPPIGVCPCAGRTSARRSVGKPLAFTPGQPTAVNFPINDVFHTFQRGHRIMIQVQASWFPFIDRNPQTFVPNIFEARAADFVRAPRTASTAHRSRPAALEYGCCRRWMRSSTEARLRCQHVEGGADSARDLGRGMQRAAFAGITHIDAATDPEHMPIGMVAHASRARPMVSCPWRSPTTPGSVGRNGFRRRLAHELPQRQRKVGIHLDRVVISIEPLHLWRLRKGLGQNLRTGRCNDLVKARDK